MIRAVALSLVLAGPAGAEAICPAAWTKVADVLGGFGEVAGTVTQDGDWCLVTDVALDQGRQYQPDIRIDALRFRGAAVNWLVEGAGAPEGLEIAVRGLRLVVRTGDAQMDWLFAAQAKPNGIDGEAAFSWDAGAKVLRLESLSVDFPGENLVEGSATVAGVDLSSLGAMQMSLTGFAVTEADLRIVTHGLFEWYVLMLVGPVLLPREGDIDAAAADLRAGMQAAVADLPGTSFSDATRDALVDLIGTLPNPAGELTVALRAEAGVGPARLAPWAMNGVPDTLAEAAGVLEGVTVDVGWSPDDAE